MLVKILDEEKDRPIVMSWSGERISLPRLTEGEEDIKIFINNEWNVLYKWTDDEEDDIQCNLPLAPGKYGKDDIRLACVMFSRFILFGPLPDDCRETMEGLDDDKYIIYEIIADTTNKTISFDIEILDDDSEIEFNFDNKEDIKNLINYEPNRIIKVKG